MEAHQQSWWEVERLTLPDLKLNTKATVVLIRMVMQQTHGLEFLKSMDVDIQFNKGAIQ